MTSPFPRFRPAGVTAVVVLPSGAGTGPAIGPLIGPPGLQTGPGLAPLLLSDHTVSDLLDVIVNVAISAVSGVKGASVSALTGDRPWFETTKASSARVRVIDETQYEGAEGPSVEAILMSQEVGIGLPTDRWPKFSEQAVLAGVCSVWSLPLTFAARTTGALNLYSTVGQPWGTATATAARALSRQAALVFNALRLSSSEMARPNRLSPPGDGDVVGQAKGMLTARQLLTGDEALDILRRVSQHGGRKLRVVAADVLSALGPQRDEG